MILVRKTIIFVQLPKVNLMYLLEPIAVKPYLKKYIGFDYPVDPFVLSTTNKYGMFFYHCILKPDEESLKLVKEHQIDTSVYSDVLKLKISEKRWREKGCIIPTECIIHFNKFVQQDFNDEFYKYVRNRLGPKGSIYRAIHDFRNIYGITEDELSYKTIERAFQRRNAEITRSLSA